MKEANTIVVMSFGMILLASIIPHPTNRARGAQPDEVRLLKAENKLLRAQIASLQKRILKLVKLGTVTYF